MEMNSDIFTPDLPIPELVEFEDAPIPAPVEEEKPAETPPPRRRRKADAPVLTIESGDEIETEDAREAAAWHEIHNAYRTRRILFAPLGGIEPVSYTHLDVYKRQVHQREIYAVGTFVKGQRLRAVTLDLVGGVA